MENDPISALISVLEQCGEAGVAVTLALRCSISQLPQEHKDRLLDDVCRVEGISKEEAEERLALSATSLSMTNASPDMGATALLSLVAEHNVAIGNLANQVLRVDEQRLRAAQEAQAEDSPKIIIPGK